MSQISKPKKIAKSIIDDFSSASSSEDEEEEKIKYSPSCSLGIEPNYFELPWNRAENNPNIIIKGTEIKVSPIPKISNQSSLYSIFKNFGDIIGIEIPEKNKSIAYIRFSSLLPAQNLISKKKILINNEAARIYPSNDNLTLFVGNLDRKWSYDQFKNLISQKISNYSSIRFISDPNNKNLNRGYAFIEFSNSLFARKAYDKISENMVVKGRALTIDWAKGLDSDNDINKCQLHISGITNEIKTEALFDALSQHGHIVNLKLSRDSKKDGRTDYGFVTYSSKDEAEKALNEFDSSRYFQTKLTLEYAKKLSSIISHRIKVKGNILERKRIRDFDNDD